MDPVDWPDAFVPSEARRILVSPGTAWTPQYGGPRQRVSAVNDYILLELTFSADYDDIDTAVDREAFLQEMLSTGRRVRMPFWPRPVPRGTLQGTPTLDGAVSPGARVVRLAGTAGQTVKAGDVLGVAGQLLIVGPGGGVVGSDFSLVMPVRVPLNNGSAVIWDRPRGLFEMTSQQVSTLHTPGGLMETTTVYFREV